MSDSPTVSVIVRTRDRLAWLREALASLGSQTFDDFETLVVDEGESALDPSALPDLRGLRLIRPGSPHGRSRALNAGLEAARGRYVAYLDDDDLYLPDHLEVLTRAILAQPGAGAVYSDAQLVRQHRQADGSYLDSEPVPIFGEDFCRSALLFSNFIPLLCLLHDRSLARQAGGVDETVDLFEDWDFLIRLSALTPFQHVPVATAIYRLRDDQTNATTLEPWLSPQSEAQRRRILAKHHHEFTPDVILEFLNHGEARRDQESRRNAHAREELEGRLGAREEEIASLRRELTRLERQMATEVELRDHSLRESHDRLSALEVEVSRLRRTVHDMTTSVAWRLFTPYWKFKEFLNRRR